MDKGVQLADLLDLAASDDVETGFSGKGNDIFGTKDGEIPVFLLTGSMRLAERRRVLAAAASGMPCIVVATHAAFSKSFQAPNLTLAVIDEQHRFGVEQRESLNSKGSTAPHLLVMTATPIPRTAAMTWFGDLDISSLTELPGGRKPIRTFVVPEDNASLMGEMFALIRKRIDAGERAYVVCPRIAPMPKMRTARWRRQRLQARKPQVRRPRLLTTPTILAKTTTGAHNAPRCIPWRKSWSVCNRCRSSKAFDSPR